MGGKCRGCRGEILPGYFNLHLLGFGIFHTEGINRDLLHDLRLQRLIAEIGLAGSDLIDNLHAFDNLTECCVAAIQMRRVLVHDKELRTGRVGSHRSGHGENASLVLDGVVHTVKEELTLDMIAGTTGAGAKRAAALNHKAGDHAVEDLAVIEFLIDQR